MNLPQVSIDSIILKGGLDQITPTLMLPNGFARQSLNFECAVTRGYSRIAGYERFDGHVSPSDTSLSGLHRYISVASYTNIPAVGNTLTASGGASGKIAYIDGLVMVIAKSTGTWAVSETVSVGATLIGTVDNIYAGPTTPEQDAIVKNAVADVYRADIAAVPGSGPVRGVVGYNDLVYAFRNNAGATATDIYKSSASGWVQVPLYKTVSFTLGGATAPADGATLTQGGVTALIKRVVRTSGVWGSNTAAGQFIITTVAGGNFAAGAATIGAVNITISGIQTQLALLPGGKFEFDEYNFAGQSTTIRLYGCDGVNKGFEFDGDVLVPITTGATTDKPTHIACHHGYLFLAVGSSAMYSSPGLPYDYTAIGGAGEIASGDTITGMITMPGNTTTGALGIYSRNNTSILYGTSSTTFNLASFNTGTGAAAYSLANMAQTFAFDDRGLNGIQTALQYGNFNSTTLTSSVLPFINERINLVTYAILNRRKSQYRVFFSDGYGLFVTVVNGKLSGCMPVYFPNPIFCAFEGKTSTGTDVNYFGSDNGMVYQMEKGTSFDGAVIDYQLQLNYSNANGPRTLKRYRKASIEVLSDSATFATFDFGYILGYDSAEYSQPFSETLSQYLGISRWDTFTWDNFFWDTNGIEPIKAELDGTAENIALLFSGSSDYVAPFTINSILIHHTPRRIMR
jgi:hypothetical protein